MIYWTITFLRLVCLVLFLYSSFTVTWQSFLALCALIASVFLLHPSPTAINIRTSVIDLSKNPFRKMKRPPDEKKLLLSSEADQQVANLLTYDAEEADALLAFQSTKFDTQCSFANKSQLWGSDKWRSNLTLEENVIRWIPTFVKFTCSCRDLGLDGFVFQLPSSDFGESIEDLADGVRRLLMTLSAADPADSRCMRDVEAIGQRGWVFEFNRVTFFLTTFAPFYAASSPRQSCDPDSSFVLFQPEISFARHDLPSDDRKTCRFDCEAHAYSKSSSLCPNVRCKIRQAFRAAGRPYHNPSSVYTSMAFHVIRPLKETLSGDYEPFDWWSELKQCRRRRRVHKHNEK